MDLKKQIGEKLKKYIETNGLNQTIFAKKIGLERENLNRILNGKQLIGTKTLISIGNVTDINLNWLLEKKDSVLQNYLEEKGVIMVDGSQSPHGDKSKEEEGKEMVFDLWKLMGMAHDILVSDTSFSNSLKDAIETFHAGMQSRPQSRSQGGVG